jgi:hypothetical protein
MGTPAARASSPEGTPTSTFVSNKAGVLEVELLCTICRRTCRAVTERLSLAAHFLGERRRTYGIVSGRSTYLTAYLSESPFRHRAATPAGDEGGALATTRFASRKQRCVVIHARLSLVGRVRGLRGREPRNTA